MRVLAIDIGTNSTLHLFADVHDGDVHIIQTGIEENQLGAGLDENNRIGTDLLTLNRKILDRLMTRSRELGCKKTGAVGTHALRRTSNAQVFLNMAEQIGLEVNIIPNVEEAALAWKGVFGKSPDKPTGLLDIGGGSTELSVGSGEKPEWGSSVSCGAVALVRQFFRNDPPTASEIDLALQSVVNAFYHWKDRVEEHVELVGVAGTVTALAAIENGIVKYEVGKLDGLVIDHGSIRKWRNSLLQMALKQRAAIPGMPPARAGSIHAGALILDEILKIVKKGDVTVSEKGVLYGLVIRLAQSG